MQAAQIENEYAYISDDKVFLKGYLEMPDRQIGIVKNSPEQAFEYFVNRYNIAKTKVETLEKEIEEAQNKGSYLTKLQQLRKRLLSFDGIGDFKPMLSQLDAKEEYLTGLINTNQTNNTTIKKALLDEARETADTEDYRGGSEALQEIKTRWIRTGPAEKEDGQDLEAIFTEILDVFYQRRKTYFDELNQAIDERIVKYQTMVDQAYQLRRIADLDEGFKELKRLQQEWKTLGEIPLKKQKEFVRIFKKNTTNYYEYYCRQKGITIEKRIDPRLKQQTDMVEEVEKLSKSDDIFAAADRAKVLLNDWKNVKVPMAVADKRLPERFRNACDKIFELSYLMKVISRKFPAFSYMTELDQVLTKFREMEYIVKRAKFDLAQLEDELKFAGGLANAERPVQSNFMTQKRKLQMKEIILEEYRAKIQG
jgi:hypothetical protein